jgi:lipopolysaccharide biosynthesis regulator YciM
MDIEEFEEEVLATIPRYFSQPNATVDIRARDNETDEVIPFAEAFPEQFELWETSESLPERRSIIYRLLDEQLGRQMAVWQLIERYNDDRHPELALEIAAKYKEESDEKDPDFWSALAKTNFILTKYDVALQCCANAMALDKDNLRTKRIYADILHCTNRTAEAHKIYNEILKRQIPSDTEMTLPIQELLGFDGDIVNSPIYAISWLKADKDNAAELWLWAKEEFCYSPHLQIQYAFYLLEQKQYMRGFLELLDLSKEMPWFKDAVVNSYNLINQLSFGHTFPNDKIRLHEIMIKNNWL